MADENLNSSGSSTGSESTDTKVKGATIEKNSNDVAIKNAQNGKMEVKAPVDNNQHEKSKAEDKTTELANQAKGGLEQKELLEQEAKKSVDVEIQKRMDLRAAFLELKALKEMGVSEVVTDKKEKDLGNLTSPDQKVALAKEVESMERFS